MPKARINTPDAMFQVDKKRAADQAQPEALVDEHRGYRRDPETSDRGVAGVGGGRAETGHETDGKATGERAAHTAGRSARRRQQWRTRGLCLGRRRPVGFELIAADLRVSGARLPDQATDSAVAAAAGTSRR